MAGTRLLDPGPTGRGVAPAGTRADVRFVAVVYGLSRLCAFAGFLATALVQRGGSLGRLPWMWDGGWYLRLAREGYPSAVPEVGGRALHSTIAFFPGFPLAIRLVSSLPAVSDPVAALLVSLGSGVLAAWAVYRLARWLAGPETARRAVLLFCFFPGSVVFSLAYAEGLMVVFAAGCLLALARRQWVTAGVLAGLAGLTRPNAVVLVAACAWAAGAALVRRRDVRAVAAPALAAAGPLLFFGYLWFRTGEPGAWFRVEHQGWDQQFDAGRSLLNILVWAVRGPFSDPQILIVTGAFVVAMAGLWCLVRHRHWPAALSIYTAGVLALGALSRLDVLRPRAVLAAFPLFIALGDRLPRRALVVVVGCFAVALVLLPWYYSLPVASSGSP
jgi:hypothetical protein